MDGRKIRVAMDIKKEKRVIANGEGEQGRGIQCSVGSWGALTVVMGDVTMNGQQ